MRLTAYALGPSTASRVRGQGKERR